MWVPILTYVISVAVSLGIAIGIQHFRRLFGKTVLTKFEMLAVIVPIFNLLWALVTLMFEDNNLELTTKLREANRLNTCHKCGKFSRNYQRDLLELERKVNGQETFYNCPHCEKARLSSYYGERFGWLKAHPDCPELTKRNILTYLQSKSDIEKMVSQMGSLNALEKYTKTTRGEI